MSQTSQNLPFIPLQSSIILQDQACCARVLQQLWLADSCSVRIVKYMHMRFAFSSLSPLKKELLQLGFIDHAHKPPGRCMTGMTKNTAGKWGEMSLEDQKPHQILDMVCLPRCG